VLSLIAEKNTKETALFKERGCSIFNHRERIHTEEFAGIRKRTSNSNSNKGCVPNQEKIKSPFYGLRREIDAQN